MLITFCLPFDYELIIFEPMMKYILNIKDWLKERSEKPQFIVDSYQFGCIMVVRLKDKEYFFESQTIKFSDKFFEISEFSPDMIHVTLIWQGVKSIVQINDINPVND